MTDNSRDQRLGIIFSLLASCVWGGAALYWIQTQPTSPIDVLAHRSVWTWPAVALVLLVIGRLRATLRHLRNPKTLAVMAVAASIISINWGTFLYAVTNKHATDASLGYFLIPILSVLLGIAFFGERPSTAQKVAIGLALLSVALQVIELRGLPVISLALSLSFACYGALRKKVTVDSIEGLFLEAMFLLPIGVCWLLFTDGAGLGQSGLKVDLFLIGAGAFTAIPLLTHVAAARRLPLSTLGLLSYVGPTLQLIVALFVLGETISQLTLLSFVVVWIGLAFILVDSFRSYRKLRSTLPGRL